MSSGTGQTSSLRFDEPGALEMNHSSPDANVAGTRMNRASPGNAGDPDDQRVYDADSQTAEENGGAGKDPGDDFEHDSFDDVHKRLGKLEKQNFRMKLALVVLVMVVGYLGFEQFLTENTIVRQTLMESREVKLLDNDGNARLFLRMYSRVPVLQLLDSKGKPRMSLGMRFDDTPFIDLSDRTGRTRATLELTENDEPTLRLFDKNGEPTFKIN